MNVIHSMASRLVKVPIYTADANLFQGALIMPGATAETDDGVGINVTASSNADAIGVLAELHDDAKSDKALVDGTVPWYFVDAANSREEAPARLVELIDAYALCRLRYDLDDTMAVASASTTTITITSLENNIDTGFLYVVGGTGVGQIEFIATSASGSCVLPTAFATQVDSTSTVIKILPLYHDVLKWDIATATDFTKIGTDAAVGTGRALILDRRIVRNGLDEHLDPHIHGGLTGLNSLAAFELYAVAQILDTAFHPVA